MNARVRLVLVVFTLSTALAIAGCSGSSGDSSKASPSSSSTPATAVQFGNARITKFDVPPTVACNGKTSIEVTVQYAVSGAKKSELLVDGRPYKLTNSSGEQKATVRCDPLPHTVVIVAYDSSNQRSAQQKLLTTNA